MDPEQRNNMMKGHLFTVEILLEDASNGQALERLLHLLNSSEIKDYKIRKGIDLGKLIELNLIENQKKTFPVVKREETDSQQIIQRLEGFKKNNALVRLIVIKEKGIKLNIPCRILNYDSDTHNVSVYHVDEKQVYLFKLNEIEDIIAV
jgi:hypothetical protein